MKISNNKLRIIFLLTNLAFQSVVGQFGVYSIIKSPMSKQFNYSEQYLGIIDFIQLIGQIAGAIFTLFLTTNPIRSFLNFGLANLFLGFLLIFPQFMIYPIIRDIFILLIFFFHGAVGASVVYSQIIFSLFFDQNSKKCEYSIWYSVTFVGEIVAFVFAQVMVYKLLWKWEYVILIWKIYLIVIALLMNGFIQIDSKNGKGYNEIVQMLRSQSSDDNGEISYDSKEQDNQIDQIGIYKIDYDNNPNIIQPNHMHQLQQLSELQKLSLLYQKITIIISNINICGLILSFSLIESLYTNLLFWLPYYYILTNNQQISTLSILLISLSLAIGGIIAEVLLFQLFDLEHVNKIITYVMLWVSCGCYGLVWWGNLKENGQYCQSYCFYNTNIQLILLIIANLLFACPYSRISSIDPIQQSNNNQHIIKIILLLGNLGRNSLNAVFVLIIGYLININPKYFWNVIFVNVLLCLVVQTIRKIGIKKQQDENEYKEQDENEYKEQDQDEQKEQDQDEQKEQDWDKQKEQDQDKQKEQDQDKQKEQDQDKQKKENQDKQKKENQDKQKKEDQDKQKKENQDKQKKENQDKQKKEDQNKQKKENQDKQKKENQDDQAQLQDNINKYPINHIQ